jgi:H2-forming N5,N10-methylenetetrahydromethanopterin dehydrogenase-like enzyme
LSAPLPQPHVAPASGEPLAVEELLATLEQMVARCEEMVRSLGRAAFVVRTNPPSRGASNPSFD